MCPAKDSNTRPVALLAQGSFATIYFALLALGAGLAIALYWGIAVAQGLDPLPKSFNAQQGAARLDAFRTSLTAVGGAAAVAGLYVAYRRQRVNEANSARELDKVFTDRLDSLSVRLESELSKIRLLSLSALVRLADDSETDRSPCLRHLFGYLRTRVELVDNLDKRNVNDRLQLADRSLWSDFSEWDVRRAAVDFLAQRLKARSPMYWSDSIDLREAVLIDAKFDDCTFEDEVDLRGAILIDANFDRCIFKGDVDFRDSIIIGAISFTWTKFYGKVDWSGAIINSEFDARTVEFRDGPNFDGATFNQKLTLGWAILTRISLESAIFHEGLTIEPINSEDSSALASTTRKINLRKARIRGAAVLPKQAIDVCGADLSQTYPLKLLDVRDYYSRPDIRGLVEDEATRWPTSDSPEHGP